MTGAVKRAADGDARAVRPALLGALLAGVVPGRGPREDPLRAREPDYLVLRVVDYEVPRHLQHEVLEPAGLGLRGLVDAAREGYPLRDVDRDRPVRRSPLPAAELVDA